MLVAGPFEKFLRNQEGTYGSISALKIPKQWRRCGDTTVSVAVLEEESQHKDTLQVTEARQYRERGLIHIEDAVYKFFMYLEKQRVHLLNDHMLLREGANMVEEAHRKLIQDDEISLKWQQCFKSEDVKEKKVQIIVKQSIHLEFCYL